MNDLIKGLVILAGYCDTPSGGMTGAEHDEIHVYATDRPVSEEHHCELYHLGFFQEGNSDGHGPYTNYQPQEGWMYYT
jgi:hypothetical protein